MIYLGLILQLLLPLSRQAYPIFAQENFEFPREKNGRLVCANCHLAEKPINIELPRSVLPNSVFDIKVQFNENSKPKQLLASGRRGPLNVGSLIILPDNFSPIGSTFFTQYNSNNVTSYVVGPLPLKTYLLNP